jgi:molecular chaperone Hsp33
MSDQLIRFIFDTTDIRGEWVQLERSYADTLANHHYSAGVRHLIGEFLAAAALLGATLKFEGTLVLQARSQGEVPLIMAEATSNHEIRAIVRGADTALSTEFSTLLANGQLAITIDPANGQRYQGIVGMERHSLGGCLEDYFLQSEQLPTRIWLAVDDNRAAGLFLQELPGRGDAALRRQQWDHLLALAGTIQPDELLTLPGETVLHRLFHQEQLRLLRRDDLVFRCSCSQARTEGMLVSLGAQEIETILAEQGEVVVNCEFCLQNYRFGPEQARALFGAGAASH